MDIYTEQKSDLIHETSVDFVVRSVSKEVHVVQYDDLLPIIKVNLFNDGERYSLPECAKINIRLGKLDHTFVYKEVTKCNQERNAIYFNVDYQMTVLDGKINIVLELRIDGTEGIASSSPIIFIIDKNPVQDSDIESETEYPIIYELRSEIEAYDGRLTVVENGLSNLDDEVDDLSTTIGTYDGRLTTIEGNISDLNDDVDACEGRLTTIEGNISDLNDDVDACEGRLTTIEGNISDLNDDVDACEGRLTTIEGNISDLNDDVDACEGRLTTIEGNISDLNDDVDALSATISGSNIQNGSGENSLQQKGNTASNIYAFAQGYRTQAVGNFAHSEGQYTIAWADISHTEGVGNVVGDLTEVAVRGTGIGGHAEGLGNRVLGEYAHAEGFGTTAKGNYSHSNGVGANDLSGSPEIAVSKYDTDNYIKNTNVGHGISYDSTNNITYISAARFIDGTQTFNDFKARLSVGSKVNFVHVTNNDEIGTEVEVYSIGNDYIYIKGQQSWNTNDIALKIEYKQYENDIYSGTAYGIGSYVGGYHNVAIQNYQTVIGKYNNNKSDTLFEVGNGTDNSNRNNAFEVHSDGRVTAGAVPSQNMDVVTKQWAESQFSGKGNENPITAMFDANGSISFAENSSEYNYLLRNGLFILTYGNCVGFVLISGDMWRYSSQSHIRITMPVIYDQSGNCRPGIMDIYEDWYNHDGIKIVLKDNQGNTPYWYGGTGYTLTIVKTNLY